MGANNDRAFNKLLLYDCVPNENIYIKDCSVIEKLISKFKEDPKKTVIVTGKSNYYKKN